MPKACIGLIGAFVVVMAVAALAYVLKPVHTV